MSSVDGTTLIREFVANSPFAQQLGLEVAETGDGVATLRMPYRVELATFEPVIHGGALAAAADTAAMVASFAGMTFDEVPVGATAGFNISYLRAARGSDITVQARVVKRGSLNFVDVELTDGDGKLVATAHVIYKLGR